MKLVFLGAPGSGKGTHAAVLSQHLGIPHVSTGDIFRKNLKEGTPIGLKVKEIMAAGLLVPDELTIEIVKQRLAESDCSNGFILDGFPRSVAQAEALDSFENVDMVVNLQVDRDEVVRRLSGRRFCPDCNGTFHVSSIGNTDVCPNCHGKLIIRSDDREETVKQRLKVYDETTYPLIDYYVKTGKMVDVDGMGSVEDVYARLLATVQNESEK